MAQPQQRFMSVKAAVIDTLTPRTNDRIQVVAPGRPRSEIAFNYVSQLSFQRYAENVHYVTVAAYAFLKYFLLRLFVEQIQGIEFSEVVTAPFLKQVWLSFAGSNHGAGIQCGDQIAVGNHRAPGGRPGEATIRYRNLIHQHVLEFKALTEYQPKNFQSASQTANYESKRLEAGFLNMVMNSFGNRLRQTINLILDLKALKNRIKANLRAAGHETVDINAFIRENVTNPAVRFKAAVGTGDRNVLRNGNFGVFNEYRNSFDFFFDCYDPQLNFDHNVYYDAKVNPENHIKAYMGLARHCQAISETGTAPFQCSPLRSKRYPMYTQIDTTILCTEILCVPQNRSHHYTRTLEAKQVLWGTIFNLQSNAFRGQGPNRSLCFRGTIYTDGVGLTVLKSNTDTQAGAPRRQALPDEQREFPYITEVNVQVRNAFLQQNCMVIDPNRRDIIYGMHEESVRDIVRPDGLQGRLVYRFTKSLLNKATRRSRNRLIRQQLLRDNNDIQLLLNNLSEFDKNTSDIGEYDAYLRIRFADQPPQQIDDFFSRSLTLNNQQPLFQ